MRDAILEIKNLNVEYKTAKINGNKTVKAVNGVSLTVKEGEIYAIAGESGCGKSTLAKAIMKLVPYKSGEILYLGKNTDDYRSEELKQYRKNVQMIFQNNSDHDIGNKNQPDHKGIGQRIDTDLQA